MTDQELLDRIIADPKVLGGKPVIRGTRLSVQMVLDRLGHGSSATELLDEYEGLSPDDIQACLLFAARSLSAASFASLTVGSL